MQQYCPDCERDASFGAKFCRTCGNRLEIESDVTTADTREYPPQSLPQSAPQFLPQTGNLPSSQINGAYPQAADAGHLPSTGSVDTARFYHPPVASAMPPIIASPMMSPPIMMTPPKKSSYAWVFWTLLGLVVVSVMLLVFGVSAIKSRSRAARRPTAVPVSAPVPPKPPDPPDAPPASGEAGAGQLTMEQLKYPGAQIEKEVTVMGQEIITMTTEDETDEVRNYYLDVFKSKPMAEDHRENKMVFQTNGEQHQMVVIEPSEETPGRLKIVAMRFGQKPSMETIFKVRDRKNAEADMKKAEEELKRAREKLQREAEKLKQ
jgi:hypothetical protein